MEEIVRLGSKNALAQYIGKGSAIYYKSGVWNEYKPITYKQFEGLSEYGNGYGYDLDTKNGAFYISNPCSSDMW